MGTLRLLPWFGVLVLVVGPPAALRRAGARWRWFAFGILSWGVALALKVPAGLLLCNPDGSPRLPAGAAAGLLGFLSAAAELGMAALFLRRARLSLPDVLAFGVGIGSFEAVWALGEGFLELADARALTLANTLAIASGWFLLERALTLVSHTADRLLVYAALARCRPLPAVVAVGLFTLCDGVASYGVLAGWDWENPLIRAGITLFLAALAVVEVLAAWCFGRRVAWRVIPATTGCG
jgi:hypothetical protein